VIRIQLPPAAIEQIAVAYSPLAECVLSLRVLLQPKRHPLHQPWVRAMRRLPRPLRERIDELRWAFGNNAPVFVAADSGRFEPFEAELALLRSMPPACVRYQFTWGLHGGALAERDLGSRRARERLRQKAEHPSELLELALEQPDEFVREFADFAAEYFERAFAREWKRIEPLLAAAADDAGERIAADGLYEALPSLSPRLRGDPRRRLLLIEKWLDRTWKLGPDDVFVLAPSVYAWPNLLVGVEDGPWPKGIIYPAPFLAQKSERRLPPAELLALLRALGDRTRLEVLRATTERPYSTQELAPIVGISEAALSKHLRVLSDAGVVSRRRQGKYVLYGALPARLEELEPSLATYLRGRDDRS
jgi:DNA-binding transcriptional ArsR family regulator